MKRFTDYGEIIDDEYTLRTFINMAERGIFNSPSRMNLIDMGAYDWFSSDKAFHRRIMKDIIPKVIMLSKSDKIDVDKTYVFFRECCPCVGPLTLEFKICDVNSGDVLYCFNKIKKGSYGEDFQGWELWDFVKEDKHNYTLRGNWNNIKKYFDI